MSWRWSRLSTLAFLVLLYAAPLSSGDKGLWLSVASMPVSLFGAIPGELAPEHTILLPDRGRPSLALTCAGPHDSAPGAGFVAVEDATLDATWISVGRPRSWSTRDTACPAPIAPRGPPA